MRTFILAICLIASACSGAEANDNRAPMTVLEVGFTLDGVVCNDSSQELSDCCPVGFTPVGFTAPDKAVICLEGE